VAWRDPPEQISLTNRANNMKKLLPLSKREERGMQRIQARLLCEYRALRLATVERWLVKGSTGK